MTGWPVHVRGHRSLYFPARRRTQPVPLSEAEQIDVYWYGKNDLLAAESFASTALPNGERGRGRGPMQKNLYGGSRRPCYFFFLYGTGRGTARHKKIMPMCRRRSDILEHEWKNPFCIFLPLSFCPSSVHGAGRFLQDE